MNILITGGTGFIGSRLCEKLLANGHQISVFSRRPEVVGKLRGQRINAVASLTNLPADDAFDAIINLAGEPIVKARWTDTRKQQLWDSRVETTNQLIDFIARATRKPSVLISGSAIGYYGDRGDIELDEDSDFVEDFAHKLCAGWEQAAFKANDHGVRVGILRIGLVIGRGGGFLQPMLMPFRLGLGGKIGDGNQWMSWIHRKDLIAMIETVLQSDQLQGVFNATAPQPVTNNTFSQTLAKLLKRPAFLPVPAVLLKVAMGEMAVLLLGGQKVSPKRFLAEQFDFRFATLESALRDALAKTDSS